MKSRLIIAFVLLAQISILSAQYHLGLKVDLGQYYSYSGTDEVQFIDWDIKSPLYKYYFSHEIPRNGLKYIYYTQSTIANRLQDAEINENYIQLSQSIDEFRIKFPDFHFFPKSKLSPYLENIGKRLIELNALDNFLIRDSANRTIYQSGCLESRKTFLNGITVCYEFNAHFSYLNHDIPDSTSLEFREPNGKLVLIKRAYNSDSNGYYFNKTVTDIYIADNLIQRETTMNQLKIHPNYIDCKEVLDYGFIIEPEFHPLNEAVSEDFWFEDQLRSLNNWDENCYKFLAQKSTVIFEILDNSGQVLSTNKTHYDLTTEKTNYDEGLMSVRGNNLKDLRLKKLNRQKLKQLNKQGDWQIFSEHDLNTKFYKFVFDEYVKGEKIRTWYFIGNEEQILNHQMLLIGIYNFHTKNFLQGKRMLNLISNKQFYEFPGGLFITENLKLK